jgi:hypothetical protein
MIPWLVVLAVTLPASTRAAHWAAAWIGLDSMEGLGLLSTGLLLLRRDGRCCLTAAVTAALVLTDAWFDVTTAAPGSALVTAVMMAAWVEVPVSVLCATVAVRTLPRASRRHADRSAAAPPAGPQAGARGPAGHPEAGPVERSAERLTGPDLLVFVCTC